MTYIEIIPNNVEKMSTEKDIEQIEQSMKSGYISMLILLALEKEPANGYKLMKMISEDTFGKWRPTNSTMYPYLSNLTKNHKKLSGNFLEVSAHVSHVPPNVDASAAAKEPSAGAATGAATPCSSVRTKSTRLAAIVSPYSCKHAC